MKQIYYAEPIPNKEPSVHCSSIIELPNQDLMVSYYAGTAEKHPDTKIYTVHYDNIKKHWNEPEVRLDTPDKSNGNAVLFLDKNQRIWLFNNTIHKEWKNEKRKWDWAATDNKYMYSDDLGCTWSENRDMFPNLIGWNFKNKPIYIQNGDILVPIYDDLEFQSRVAISPNNGKTWELSGLIKTEKSEGRKIGNIQPSLIEKENGNIIALLRPRTIRKILYSISINNGKNWTKTYATKLKNPNSGIDAVKLNNGHVVLVYNDISFYQRYKLSVALSEDEGNNWKYKKTLELSFPWKEFSYPAVIQDSHGLIHITYTYKREYIKHVVINEAWIKS